MADLENIDNTAPANSLYEGSVKINLIRDRVDGLYTVLSDITAAEANQVENLGTTAITAAQWVYLGELDQSLTTTSTVTFGTINAFTLGGKLTAGAVEIEGSAFDINGGTIDGVSLTDITMSLGSDADGDIYYRSSNKLVRLAKGTEDYVLTMGAAVPEWAAAGAGAGDITGPDTSTDHAIPRWHETGGDELLDSGITISDGNALTIGSGHTLDVSGGTLTLAANQISGDKVEGGTIAAITITSLTAGVYTLPSTDGTLDQMLKTDGSGTLSWTTIAAGGDVAGPASATDNAIAKFHLTTGKIIQNSGVTIADTNVITCSGITLGGNLNMSGGQYDIQIPENAQTALDIKEGINLYIRFCTLDAGEKITIYHKLEAGAVEIEGSAFDINGGYIDNTVVGNGNPSTGSFTTLSLRSVGELRFFDNGNYVGFEAPALDANQIWVLPTADGAANTVLKTDGSGNLGWATAPGADAALSNLASVAINESLISDTDDQDDLGSDAKQWKDLYINGTANIDSLVADTADINAGTIGGVTLDGAIAGGDQVFTNVGDMTFAAGSILKSGSTNTNTLLLAANDTTFITLTTGDTDTLGIGAFTLSGKLTGGASEIEGSGFDIDGGDISAVTISGGLTWSASQNLGAYSHYINDTANTGMTTGLTINQGAAIDECLCLKSSVVDQPMTDFGEADSYGLLFMAQGTSGGLNIRGLKDADGDAGYALMFDGFLGEAADDTKSTAGLGIVLLRAYVTNGGTGVQAPAADGNLVVYRSGSNTRFIFDQEGELHTDDIIGVGDDWDKWDDLQLASDISRLPKAKFDEMVRYRGKDFEKAGLLTLSVDEDGQEHAFIRHKAMLQFSMCCFAEIADKLKGYERAFEKLGIDKKELLALETGN